MRNEERNVAGIVTSVRSSTGIAHWDLTVLNDASTDKTLSKLEEYEIATIHGAELPDGWLGKNWACWQLAKGTQGDFLVFLDADVRITSEAISSSIALMNTLKWDFISPYPRQIAKTFLERIIQPLLQWSWLASVPLRLAQRLGISSMTIANGQFFIVKRSAYMAIGGHEAIKAEVLDDLRLARALIEAGFRGGVAEGSSVAECRMYENATDLVDGYTKSLWNAFGGIFGTILTIGILLTTQVAPILLGIAGNIYGWIAFLIVSLSHAIAALRTRSAPANIFLHPLAAIFLIALIIESMRRKKFGTLIWRERYLP